MTTTYESWQMTQMEGALLTRSQWAAVRGLWERMERAEAMRHAPPIMTPEAAAKYLGLHWKTMANMRSRGVGPAYVWLSPGTRKGRVGYRVRDLEAYVESRTVATDGQVAQ